MVEQHGTLNFTKSGAFLVVSLPVSAFRSVEDDSDGFLNQAELGRHHSKLVSEALQGFEIWSNGQKLPLEGALFNLPSSHHGHDKSDHVILMGRFTLPIDHNDARLHVKLFGRDSPDKILEMVVERNGRRRKFTLTPEKPSASLLANAEHLRSSE